jgi:aldose 1-epimerase
MRRSFGETAAGEPVEEIVLTGGGLTAKVLNWGGVLRDLRLDGVDRPLVLGLETIEAYEARSPFFGAIAGRCANRIREGRFTLDGREHRLALHGKAHHLHGGGPESFGRRVWRVEAADARSVQMVLVSEDGDAGYPGRLTARCEYRLEAPATLCVTLTAGADAPTLCNLAHHGYWSLDGAADVGGHLMEVPAEAVCEIDEDWVATGALARVEGTRLDLRRPAPLADDGLRDHNYCLAAARVKAPRPVGRLSAGGLALDILSTEPGLQVYDGAKIPEMEGLDGRRYGRRAGVALEPQLWPDAPNHPHFPSAVLRPGEAYRQVSLFRLSAA